jgi:hypothetical protein
MIRALRFPDATIMHERMCRKLMLGDFTGEGRMEADGVQLNNVVIGLESFAWDFDLKRLWMPESRWRMMVRQYIDPRALDQWKTNVSDHLTKHKNKGRGIAVLRTEHPDWLAMTDGGLGMRTNNVQGYGRGKGVRRRWGSCMLALSYRQMPKPTVTLHSRTTYFGYLAAMDLTVAHVFAREASALTGVAVEDMQMVWILEQAQFHGFRSLAWPLGNPELKAMMDENIGRRRTIDPQTFPGYRRALDGYERILRSDRAGKLYGDEAYSSFARVRRRFHTEVYGVDYAAKFEGGVRNRGGKSGFPPLPSVDIRKLDFSCLGMVDGDLGLDDDDE